MKIRWTQSSIRFRITPTELNALLAGSAIVEKLQVPGGAWSAEIIPETTRTTIGLNVSGHLVLSLAHSDVMRLADPSIEGIYFSTDTPLALKYWVEKDFPCVHPRAGEAADFETETFKPPIGFQSME